MYDCNYTCTYERSPPRVDLRLSAYIQVIHEAVKLAEFILIDGLGDVEIYGDLMYVCVCFENKSACLCLKYFRGSTSHLIYISSVYICKGNNLRSSDDFAEALRQLDASVHVKCVCFNAK
jgi:hypothetical protein